MNHMINEERVKELYRMAVYDAYEDVKCQQTGKYYISDYVGKEMIKSFFTGTIAFVLLVVLWGIGDVSALIAFSNNADVMDLVIHIIMLYAGFMAIYLFVTAVVYRIRYDKRRKELHQYVRHAKKVQEMYRREDKLKA